MNAYFINIDQNSQFDMQKFEMSHLTQISLSF